MTIDVNGRVVWSLASCGLILVGAFGPWATVLSVSVGGTSNGNDGWIIAAIAAVVGLLITARREHTGWTKWAICGGIVNIAITAYDRHHVSSTISQAGALGAALAHVGWGLNLALAASFSLALAGLASLARSSAKPPQPAPAAAPPTVPSSVPAGWYRDPNSAELLRYWNGEGWTTQTAKPAN